MEESGYFKGRKDLIGIMKKIPFLKPYEEKCLVDILAMSKMRRYSAGELITMEGQYDCWLYVILSGEVRVTKQGEEIATLDSRRGTFGELSVIDGGTRSASVCAVTDTACLAIDMSLMDRMGDGERKAFDAVYYRTLSEILAQRLRTTSNRLARLQGELEQLKLQHPSNKA